eukprot:gene138-228_t
MWNSLAYMAGDLASQGEPDANTVIGPFIFSMHMLCPTYCASAARVLGLFRERTSQKETYESGLAKQVLHILFRAVDMWSKMADDLKNEDVNECDLPRIVIKFVPDKQSVACSQNQTLQDTVLGGDGAWLEGYEHLRYMLIFFVFDGGKDDVEDAEDENEDGDEHNYKIFVNKILRDMYVENQKRSTSLNNAYVNAVSKNGMQLAKKMQIEKQNLMDKHLGATGNSLDCETCIDLSYAPTSANDMHKIMTSFLNADDAPTDFQRRTDADIYFSSLFPASATREYVMKKYDQSHPGIDWASLLVSIDNGESYLWNLRTPFVIRINASDFTSVVWERSIQPTFAASVPFMAGVETTDTGSEHEDERMRLFIDDEAEEGDDDEISVLEEQEASSEIDEMNFTHQADAEEELLRQQRQMEEEDGASSEAHGSEMEEGLEEFSVHYMGKRAREIVARNMRRLHKEPRLAATANRRTVATGTRKPISYGIFDPEGLIGEFLKKQRELGIVCSRSGLYIARVVMDAYWTRFYDEIRDISKVVADDRYKERLRCLLRNLFMCVICPRVSGLRLILPMPDSLARGLKPFMDTLDDARNRRCAQVRTLQVPTIPYAHANLSVGMNYVADFWAYLDKAVRVDCLHYMGFMLHLCYTSVYATPFEEYERLPHVWMSGLHSVGKSFVVNNVAYVSLPDDMVERLNRETNGAAYISEMTNTEQLKTYKVKMFLETPMLSMGISRHSKETDANAKLKAEMTGDDIGLNRSFRNEQTNKYELEKICPKVRELLVFVMNQPLQEVEPSLQSRGLDMMPSRLNRVRVDLSAASHQEPLCRPFGQVYPLSQSDSAERLERETMLRARQWSTKEFESYRDAEYSCEKNVRQRQFYIGVLYQAAVRVKLCHGVDMLEVEGRRQVFSKVLQQIPLVTPDKMSRRLSDISSLAYTLTVHTAVWRAFVSADSPLRDCREFDASMLLEVDKNAVCSSSIAIFAFSAVAKCLINEPMRMMLFYARYALLDVEERERVHPARETSPIDTSSDAYVEDTDYYVISSTMCPKTAAPARGLSRADICVQDHFIRDMLRFYETPENARRYGKDTLTISYAKTLLEEFVDTKLFCIRDCVHSEKVYRAVCVNKNHVRLEGCTTRGARIDDDGLVVSEIVKGVFDANTRCQRVLLCEAARFVEPDSGEEFCVPQLPQHIDVPDHAESCERLSIAYASNLNQDRRGPDLSGVTDSNLHCRADEGCTCFRSARPKYPDGVSSMGPLEDTAFERRMLAMRLLDKLPKDRDDASYAEYMRLIRLHHPTLCTKTSQSREVDSSDRFYPLADLDRIVCRSIESTSRDSASQDTEWQGCLL